MKNLIRISAYAIEGGLLIGLFDGVDGDIVAEMAVNKLMKSLKHQFDRKSSERLEKYPNMIYPTVDNRDVDIALNELKLFIRNHIDPSIYAKSCSASYMIGILRHQKLVIITGGSLIASFVADDGSDHRINAPHVLTVHPVGVSSFEINRHLKSNAKMNFILVGNWA